MAFSLAANQPAIFKLLTFNSLISKFMTKRTTWLRIKKKPDKIGLYMFKKNYYRLLVAFTNSNVPSVFFFQITATTSILSKSQVGS